MSGLVRRPASERWLSHPETAKPRPRCPRGWVLIGSERKELVRYYWTNTCNRHHESNCWCTCCISGCDHEQELVARGTGQVQAQARTHHHRMMRVARVMEAMRQRATEPEDLPF